MKLWEKVWSIGEECRERVRGVVEEIAREIVRIHGDRIEVKLKEFGIKGILSIKVEDTDPTKIYPCLYLVIPREEYYRRRFSIGEELGEELGSWSYHARLKLEVVHPGVEDTITPKIKIWGE